jgi:Zn-dependent protease with chaperone function
MNQSVIINPWRTRQFSRYAAIEGIAVPFAFAISLCVPWGPALVLTSWLLGAKATLLVAAAWAASGLLVVAPPVSEAVVTWLVGAREPTTGELLRLGPAWNDACRTTAIDSHRFVLRVLPCPPPSPDEPWYVNAVAAGANVVGVTADALVLLSDGELRALLAHELGHQAGSDALPRGLIAWYLGAAEAFGRPIGGWLLAAFLRLLYAPIVLVLALAGRPSEFAADAFAARAGYGRDLRRLMLRLGPNNPPSLTAAILASHPATVDRVRHLELSEQPA